INFLFARTPAGSLVASAPEFFSIASAIPAWNMTRVARRYCASKSPSSGNPSPSRRRSSHGPPQQSVEAESNAGPPGEEHGEDEQVHEPVLADEVRRLEHRPAREVVLRHHEEGERGGERREQSEDEQGPEAQLSEHDDAGEHRVVRRHRVQIARDHAVGGVRGEVGEILLEPRMGEPGKLLQAGADEAHPGRDAQEREADGKPAASHGFLLLCYAPSRSPVAGGAGSFGVFQRALYTRGTPPAISRSPWPPESDRGSLGLSRREKPAVARSELRYSLCPPLRARGGAGC